MLSKRQCKRSERRSELISACSFFCYGGIWTFCQDAGSQTVLMSDRKVMKTRPKTRLETRARSRRPGLGSDANTADRDEAIPEQWIARLNHALKSMADRGELNRNPLSRLRYVQRVAEEEYHDQILPRGLALRRIILECIRRLTAALEGESGSTKLCKYLELRASGLSCRRISEEFGLTREHVSRLYRRKALELLAQEFIRVVGRNR